MEEEEPIRDDAEALEGYAIWLSRMEVPVTDVLTMEGLEDYMRRRFMRDDKIPPRNTQVRAVWGAKEGVYRFQATGIKPFLSRTTIGPPLRFGVTNMRGAFGIKRAREIFTERTGAKPPF